MADSKIKRKTGWNQSSISHEELLAALHYDPNSGIFRWRKTQGVAGNKPTEKYRFRYVRIMINGASFLGHRLAWFYVNGVWPKDHIDHIDGDGLNNRISNLREASAAQNLANTALRSNNKSGFKGVARHNGPRNKKWTARINVRGRQICLGYFHSPEEAHAAYRQAAVKFYGAFARFK